MKNLTTVTCPICNNNLSSLSSKHLKNHNLTIKELRLLYPDVKIYSDDYLENKKLLDENYRKSKKLKLQEYFKNYRIINKDKRNCYQQKYRKDNLDIVRLKDKIYSEGNKDKKKEYDIKYRELNKERLRLMGKEYRNKNKDLIKQKKNEYNTKNPHIVAWRRILNNSLRDLGNRKRGKTIELLGYSALDLKLHIEELFTEGMSWDNYGEWHIDHIKQIISFDKHTHPSVVNALSNLRPLWATTREINGVVYEGNLNRIKYNERKNINGN